MTTTPVPETASDAKTVDRLMLAIANVAIGLADIALFIPAWILRAWVISVIWQWYMVPAFGLAPLRMVFAYGLTIIAACLRSQYRVTEDTRPKNTQRVYLFAPSLLLLTLGWIGTWFI